MFDYGLLWLDDTKREFADKVRTAAERHKTKYGTDATICYVNPSMLPDGKSVTIDGITVAPLATVAPSNFWLGVDAPKKRKPRTERTLDRYSGEA